MTDRELLQVVLDELEHCRVFVTTREKIKHPEGTELYDKCIEALRARVAQPEPEHDFYTTADKDRPEVICDRNGEVVLNLCKRCGKGEADLIDEPCVQPVPEPFGWYNAEHDEIITNSWYMEQRKKNPSDDSGFSIPLYTTPQYTKLDPVGYHYRGRFSTEKNAPGIGIYGVPVYTAPPQREWMEQERAVGYREGHQAALKQRVWQGLTDEEIEYIVDAYWDDPPMFIEAIEAKLKKENDF